MSKRDFQKTMPNEFSDTWFEVFLDSIDPAQTDIEVDFLVRQLPLPRYERVVDLCCGSGRHARPLAARGYRVTGVDNNMTALSAARRAGPREVSYIEGDMRDRNAIAQATDAVLCMWQSFGYFDEATNEGILANLSNKLRAEGRFILDVYNRDYFETRLGTERVLRGGEEVTQLRTMNGNRLTVDLSYSNSNDTDQFGWYLFSPAELEHVGRRHGLAAVAICADWDEEIAPSPNKGRMQLVFQKDER